jgi:hypothetical protein
MESERLIEEMTGAYNAVWAAWPNLDATSVDACRRAALSAALALARPAILEEAAKVAEGWATKFREGSSGKVYTSTVVVICGSIAEDIRSLSPQSQPASAPSMGEKP